MRRTPAYRMTARRRTALRKAQLASARKRRRRRNVAIGAGILAAGGVAAYGGWKAGPKAGGIAADLKARTPKSTAGAMRKARSVVDPIRKEAERIRNGVTKGFKRGAGPEAGQSKPRPRNVTITDQDRWNAQQVRNRMAAEDAKNESLVFGEGPRSRKDEWGNGKDTSLFGVPGAVIRGRRLSGRKFSSIMDRDQRKKSEAGVQSMTEEQRQEMFNWAKGQGIATGRYQNEWQRKQERIARAKRRNSGKGRRRRGRGRRRQSQAQTVKPVDNWIWQAREQNFREKNV